MWEAGSQESNLGPQPFQRTKYSGPLDAVRFLRSLETAHALVLVGVWWLWCLVRVGVRAVWRAGPADAVGGVAGEAKGHPVDAASALAAICCIC